MKYVVLDIETESHNYRSRFSDPLDPNNKIVMIQFKYDNQEIPVIIYNNGEDLRNFNLHSYIDRDSILVGQNFKFDLLYLWRNDSIKKFLMNGGKIWDTRTVEYLLNSCRKDVSYSLDSICERQELGQKYNKVKDMYKGNKKLKIPPLTTMEIIEKVGIEEFRKYAEQDVLLTEKVFKTQRGRVDYYGMEDLISSYMDYYVSIVETEYNGLYIDINKLVKQKEGLENKLGAIEVSIVEELSSYWVARNTILNIDSNDHLSLLFFGGVLREHEKGHKEENGEKLYYKNGNPKIGVTAIDTIFPSMVMTPEDCKIPSKKLGFYSVDKEVLTKLLNYSELPIFSLLLNYKKLSKLHTDIQKKIEANRNPYTGCLHSEFNTTSTYTGRLSSSNPGSQNLHPDTLDLFTSKFYNGVIMEFDWSQIEVAMAAYMFNDDVLTNEVLSKIDMHRKNAAFMYHKTEENVTIKERKQAKFMTFGILYGQSAYGLAKNHNMTEAEAKIVIDKFYSKYLGIQKAHDRLDNYFSSSSYSPDEYGKEYAILRSPTEKTYCFMKYPSKYGLKFNRSQYKNYILQGTAGDLHAYCVGKLFREYLLKNRDKCVIINNVHDSIILDVNKEFVNIVKDAIIRLMEGYAKEYLNTDLFTMDCKYGKSWGDCKK